MSGEAANFSSRRMVPQRDADGVAESDRIERSAMTVVIQKKAPEDEEDQKQCLEEERPPAIVSREDAALPPREGVEERRFFLKRHRSFTRTLNTGVRFRLRRYRSESALSSLLPVSFVVEPSPAPPRNPVAPSAASARLGLDVPDLVTKKKGGPLKKVTRMLKARKRPPPEAPCTKRQPTAEEQQRLTGLLSAARVERQGAADTGAPGLVRGNSALLVRADSAASLASMGSESVASEIASDMVESDAEASDGEGIATEETRFVEGGGRGEHRTQKAERALTKM